MTMVKKALTVNAESNCCLIFLSILHGSVENDASESCAIVVFRRRDGQCAYRLMILRPTTIYDGLQRRWAAITVPSAKIEFDT